MNPQLNTSQSQILNRLFKRAETEKVQSSLRNYAKRIRTLCGARTETKIH
jgi:hypothetical protein